MTEPTSYAPGTPSWIDLGTPDPAAAAAFYTDLFGWDVIDQGPEAGNYRMCELRGKPVAGLGPQMNTDMPPWWTTYITVASADDIVTAVTANAGTVMVPPMDVMDVGRMAVCADPGGAVFSIWEPRAHIGCGIVNEPGTLCWNELTTRDAAAQAGFYSSVFGWTQVAQGPPMNYVEFQLGGASIGGMMPMEGEMWPADLPNHWMVYFAVADADDAAARIVELGGSVSVEPTDIPPGRFAVVSDPQGAMFSIIAMTAPAA
jgi:predicted enzyme related to lactoylglutathione lyase